MCVYLHINMFLNDYYISVLKKIKLIHVLCSNKLIDYFMMERSV